MLSGRKGDGERRREEYVKGKGKGKGRKGMRWEEKKRGKIKEREEKKEKEKRRKEKRRREKRREGMEEFDYWEQAGGENRSEDDLETIFLHDPTYLLTNHLVQV